MATFVTGKVIRRNTETFLDTDLVNYGVSMPLPTPGSGGDPSDGDFWAVPITDNNVVDNFNFVPTTPGSSDKPTPQSFHVFRLITVPGRAQRNTWYALGTTSDYINASKDAECCDLGVDDQDAPILARELPSTVTPIAPDQVMCKTDVSGDYYAVFGAPTIPPSTGKVYAYGWFNGAPLTALSGSGYTTIALLVTAMNTNWGTPVGGTFAYANGVITLTQTAGSGHDVISINIYAA